MGFATARGLSGGGAVIRHMFAFVAVDVVTTVAVGCALAAWMWIVALLVRDDLGDQIRREAR